MQWRAPHCTASRAAAAPMLTLAGAPAAHQCARPGVQQRMRQHHQQQHPVSLATTTSSKPHSPVVWPTVTCSLERERTSPAKNRTRSTSATAASKVGTLPASRARRAARLSAVGERGTQLHRRLGRGHATCGAGGAGWRAALCMAGGEAMVRRRHTCAGCGKCTKSRLSPSAPTVSSNQSADLPLLAP